MPSKLALNLPFLKGKEPKPFPLVEVGSEIGGYIQLPRMNTLTPIEQIFIDTYGERSQQSIKLLVEKVKQYVDGVNEEIFKQLNRTKADISASNPKDTTKLTVLREEQKQCKPLELVAILDKVLKLQNSLQTNDDGAVNFGEGMTQIAAEILAEHPSLLDILKTDESPEDKEKRLRNEDVAIAAILNGRVYEGKYNLEEKENGGTQGSANQLISYVANLRCENPDMHRELLSFYQKESNNTWDNWFSLLERQMLYIKTKFPDTFKGMIESLDEKVKSTETNEKSEEEEGGLTEETVKSVA